MSFGNVGRTVSGAFDDRSDGRMKAPLSHTTEVAVHNLKLPGTVVDLTRVVEVGRSGCLSMQ